jgi:hypothetical protein
MTVKDNIIPLIIDIRNFLEDLNDSHLKPFLEDWPSAKCVMRSILPRWLPVLSHLPAVVQATTKKTEFLVNMLTPLANHMAWGQTYIAQDLGAEFLEKYGWTELIGLRGPVASNRVACGFLLLGPQLEYPSHFHEAEEVYVPLTGQTLWQRSEQSWVYRTPGLPIYHASRVPHAIRTEAIPLLALYLWRGGNLVQKSMFAASRAAFPPHPAHG